MENLGYSLYSILNRIDIDGIDVEPTEIVLADGTHFTIEFIQAGDSGVLLSNADGANMRPFSDLGTDEDREKVYDLTINALYDSGLIVDAPESGTTEE